MGVGVGKRRDGVAKEWALSYSNYEMAKVQGAGMAEAARTLCAFAFRPDETGLQAASYEPEGARY